MNSQSIFEDVSSWVDRQPSVPAIFEDSREVTYGELNSRAAGIAQRMHDFGAEQGDLVPIITCGGADMVAGMLACLRMAAVFVPIDVHAPVERTKHMLSDLSPRFAIVDPELDVSHLVDRKIELLRAFPDGRCNISRRLHDASTIYGFFTSGSTGSPKCCLNTHLGLANRFAFNTSVYPLQPGDAVMQNSKHTFDPVLWQTLWPLTRGATVVIPKRDGLLDIEKTVNTVERHHVVMTDIVPSVLSVLLDYLSLHRGEIPKLNSLRELFVGGEEISPLLVQRSLKLLPWVRLTNTYGPTEAAIGMIYHHFDGSEDEDIPLGKPIPGTTCEIVDQNLKPVAEGTTGQLVIAGNCLGAGYLHDDDKTAAAFKSIALGQRSVRHFLTGDRALQKDGRIYFRGRTDKQLKIRGVRIELKEIEETYERHPEIVQLRVVPVENGNQELRLHAFFTAHGTLAQGDLRHIGKQSLPLEFIPSSFRQLPEFATTSSGKIDRAILKKLAAAEKTSEPESSVDVVKGIIEQQLGQKVGLHENLFEAGMDSLNAMRLALTIEEQFRKPVSASQLYRTPTVTGIQEFLSTDCKRLTTSEDKVSDLSQWCEVDVSADRPQSTVLLTGATGYLGAHLLVELSNRINSKVVCLVRGPSLTAALHRLHEMSAKYGLHGHVVWDRVEVVLGDLAKKQLGMDASTRDRLTGNVSAIYNAGADVSFVKPFSQLEAANVKAVIALAEIAKSTNDCHLHHVSSSATLSMSTMRLDLPPEVPELLPAGGYAQSKLAAELAVKSLMDKGLKATVYRVGEIMPSPTHVFPNPRSSVVCYLRTLAFIRAAPSANDTVDYCPIDIVARTIAEHNDPNIGFVGLANQDRIGLAKLVTIMNKSGAQISICGRKRVFDAIRSASEDHASPDFVSITWDTIRNHGPDVHWPIMSFCERPVQRLGAVEKWPEIDTKYLSAALSRMIKEQGATPAVALALQ